MSDALGIFVLGLAYGATTCSVTCLPYVAPYLLLARQGFREGMGIAFMYLAGKAATYTLLGTIAGATGQALSLPQAETPVRLVQGCILILSGLALPFLSRRTCARRVQRFGRRTSLFALGASTSLVPCLPVSSLILVASQSGSVFESAALGLLYGAAIVVSPLLLGGGVFALVGRAIHAEAGQFLPYLRGLSMATLVFMGMKIVIS